MRLTELIAKLQGLLEKHGDLLVVVDDDTALCIPSGNVFAVGDRMGFWDIKTVRKPAPEELIVVL